MPRVEFLGLAQRYAGTPSLECSGSTLGQILATVHTLAPAFALKCEAGQMLPAGLIVCVNEHRFTADPQFLISSTDRILILSADVGG